MKVAKFTRTNYKYQPIDSLPFPDYEPFGIKEMLEEYSVATRVLYRYTRVEPRPFIIVASRSCPYNCSFCVHHHRAIPYRARSIENIMEEIRVNYQRYQFNILIIIDELFVVNRQRMNEFSQGILAGRERYGWDFDWCFQTHANARLDLESLKLARQAGCFMFSYGLESASPTVLKSMRKKLQLPQVVEAMRMAEEAGICFSGNLIFGDIAETQDTVAESLSFWFEYSRRQCLFLAEVKPYPGSALFEDCLKRGLITDKANYYATIDEKPINMTQMSNESYAEIMRLLSYLETRWIFVNKAKVVKCEQNPDHKGKYQFYSGEKYYLITAECPHCGQSSVFGQYMKEGPFMLGMSCLSCQRKIKIEVTPQEVK